MPAKAKVAIVVDSTTALPQGMVEAVGLLVVPIELVFEKATYRDGQLGPPQFYQMLTEAKRLPTTSAPRPASYLEAFTEASRWAEGILCLSLASHLSASHDSARTAIAMARETLPETPIALLDTQTAAGAQGFIALEAARAARQGATLEEVTQRAQGLIPRVRLVALLDTLYYVWKGGRVPLVGFWASSALNLKPILELSRGEIHLITLTRTRAKGMHRLRSLLQEASSGGSLHVNVVHTNAPVEAGDLRERVAREVACAELFVSEMSTAVGAHTGPGLLGVAFYADGPSP